MSTDERRGFGSDNHATVHPRILAALAEANRGHVPSYGGDPWTLRAEELFRAHFGPQARTFFVFNGTAANTLSLRLLTRPGQSVLCSDTAHIHQDEAAGPEFFIQGKLQPLPSIDGKLTVAALEEAWTRRGDVHFAQSRVLSLTQPTELGTLYTLDELRALIGWAKTKSLFVHVDGARLAVAAEALGVGFAAMTTELGVDVVSFGGTKNGLLGGEAVVVLSPALAADFPVLRKQAGQLPSKTRFVSAQFVAFFENDTWREIAAASLRHARRLAEGVRGLPGVEITRPVESNVVFARVPKEWTKALREKYFFYVWNENTWECRWMTSWDLRDDDVDGFVARLKELG